jgi:hypothetical protein
MTRLWLILLKMMFFDLWLAKLHKVSTIIVCKWSCFSALDRQLILKESKQLLFFLITLRTNTSCLSLWNQHSNFFIILNNWKIFLFVRRRHTGGRQFTFNLHNNDNSLKSKWREKVSLISMEYEVRFFHLLHGDLCGTVRQHHLCSHKSQNHSLWMFL